MSELEDKVKAMEKASEVRLDSRLPLFVRLDGRSFSNYTRKMDYPFDSRFSELMVQTAEYLTKQFHADTAYVGSDEITLLFNPKNEKSTHLFDGRVQKVSSVLAGAASAFFAVRASTVFDHTEQLPHFDCRAFSCKPHEVREVFLNRYLDVQKNAISKAASVHFSHKELDGMSTAERKAGIAAKGVDYEKTYTEYDRKGVFLYPATEKRMLSDEELASIPEKFRPTGPVDRSVIRASYLLPV